MSAADSEIVFKARLAELGLNDFLGKFVEKGWVTFADFACCCSDLGKGDGELFQKEVVDVILADNVALVPRLRRLYLQSYAIYAADME